MKRTFAERLNSGEPLVCGQGFLFEMERRGYLQAGTFVPEVVLEHPDALKQFHVELLRCGSDVALAFTYYGHRAKLRLIGKEHLLEPLNREAIRLVKAAIRDAGTPEALVAGNICNTNVFDPEDPATHEEARGMFADQLAWAADEGVDLIVGETFYYLQEARIALQEIHRLGLPAVVTFGLPFEGTLRDGHGVADACAALAHEGAEVVGLNCFRGPDSILPELPGIVASVGKEAHVGAVPVPYRTDSSQPTFFGLEDHGLCCPERLPVGRSFPTALEPFQCTRYEMADFTEKARAMGVSYFGICCGASPVQVRSMAEALGKQTLSSKYSPDMSKHFHFGSDSQLSDSNRAQTGRL